MITEIHIVQHIIFVPEAINTVTEFVVKMLSRFVEDIDKIVIK